MNAKTSGLLGLAALGLLGAAILLRDSRVYVPTSPTRPPPPEAPATTAETHRAPQPATEASWTESWRKLNSAPPGTERDALLAAFLEELAATDPKQALALAASTADPDLRNKLLQATVRGWASEEPETALAWARSQSVFDQGLAIAAVFHGAVHNPDRAVQLATAWTAQDPARARAYSASLVVALSQSGWFGKAAAFAAGAPDKFRTDLLTDVYARWAEKDPREALAATTRLPDVAAQQHAFNAVLSRWAYNDPRAAAEYVPSLHSEQARTFAIVVALPTWALRDPVAAASWAGRLDPSPELDHAMATIATHPLVLRQPENALMWAEGIVDLPCKIRVLATVLNGWAAINPDAAKRQAETLAAAHPEQREALFAAFSPNFEPMSLLP